MAFTDITVTGQWLTPLGTAAEGEIRLRLTAPMQDSATAEIISRQMLRVTLDGTGSMSEVLPATTDPTTVPEGVTYEVWEVLEDNTPRRHYFIELPHDAAGGTIDLSSITPVDGGDVQYGVTEAELAAEIAALETTLDAYATTVEATALADAAEAAALAAAIAYADALGTPALADDATRSILSRFAAPDDAKVALVMDWASLVMALEVNDGYWWGLRWDDVASGLLVITSQSWRRALHTIDVDDELSMMRDGATTRPTQATAWNGYVRRFGTAGAYIRFTPPSATVTGFGIRTINSTSTGLGQIWIDGDAEAANLCPTAQSLVDEGVVANTILVANGGPFNPDDRVWDPAGWASGSITYDLTRMLAVGLTAGRHTLEIRATGLKRTASADDDLYIGAFGWEDSDTHLTDPTMVWADPTSVNHDDASAVYTGTWTNGTNAGAFNGNYKICDTAGGSVTYTTPAGQTRVGVRYPAIVTSGIVKVSIDGDATLATLIPTAQELVDRGVVASTVLVANGGTLNPTDRCYNGYDPYASTDWDRLLMLATALSPAAHTVTLAHTGYKSAAASDERVHVGGWMYGVETETAASDGRLAELYYGQQLTEVATGTEISFNLSTSSGGTYTYVGTGHGNEDDDGTPDYYVDGAAMTVPTDHDEGVVGDEIIIVVNSNLTHPDVDAGATDIADVQKVYRLTRQGLEMANRTVWTNVPDLFSKASYAAMWPYGDRYTRFTGNDAATVTVDADDATTHWMDESNTIWGYDADDGWAVVIHVPDLPLVMGNNTLTGGVEGPYVWDRVAPNGPKVYFPRTISTVETVETGDVWIGRYLVRAVKLVAPAVWLDRT